MLEWRSPPFDFPQGWKRFRYLCWFVVWGSMEKKCVHYKYVLRCSIVLVRVIYRIDWGLGKTDSEVQFSPERPCLDAGKSTIRNVKHKCWHNDCQKYSLQNRGKFLVNHFSQYWRKLKQKKKKKTAGKQSNMFQPIRGEASCPYTHWLSTGDFELCCTLQCLFLKWKRQSQSTTKTKLKERKHEGKQWLSHQLVNMQKWQPSGRCIELLMYILRI